MPNIQTYALCTFTFSLQTFTIFFLINAFINVYYNFLDVYHIYDSTYGGVKFVNLLQNALLFYCTFHTDSSGGSTDAVARHVSFSRITCIRAYERSTAMLTASIYSYRPSLISISLIKAVQTRTMKASPSWAATKTQVFCDKISCRWVRGFHSSKDVKTGASLKGRYFTVIDSC